MLLMLVQNLAAVTCVLELMSVRGPNLKDVLIAQHEWRCGLSRHVLSICQ